MTSLSIVPFYALPSVDSSENLRLSDKDRAMVPSSAPHVPSYTDEGDRLASFDHWFFDSDQTPASLAKAGLYFLGPYHTDLYAVHDLTRCFHCGSVFGCWFSSDDVMSQHLTRRPDCLFARQAAAPDIRPPAVALQAMYLRWSHTTLWTKLENLGVSVSYTQPLMERIYKEKLGFPSDFVSLYQMVSQIAESCIKDTVAGDSDLKCSCCRNQAIILYQPCGHVRACLACSRMALTCDSCGVRICGRVVSRLI